MRLGIDFGTSQIVAACVDRGNYPAVRFDSPHGEPWSGFPALIASREDGALLYGFKAWEAQGAPGSVLVRSVKRLLGDAGPDTNVRLGDRSYTMLELLTGMVREFRRALAEESSLSLKAGEPLEVMLGVPANSNGNQRFLTAEIFREAGFDVLGLLNEPSASGVEYGHSIRAGKKGASAIVIYDLGAGTFDASLVEVGEHRHEVMASEGIPNLGGDDFDEILAELALDQVSPEEPRRDSLSQTEWFRLQEECRQKKESLHPNTRRISVDLAQVRDGWPAVTVAAADFYERCQPLIDSTIEAVVELMRDRDQDFEALYVVGGGSELPAVSRALKDRFGRRVRRSAYPRASAAIGLAIQADEQAGYVLREKFTRHFGVWREAEGGAVRILDPLFPKGTPLPAPGDAPLRIERKYSPAHNIGRFRYLECSHTTSDGRPGGDEAIWDEIVFPFDETLQRQGDVVSTPILRTDEDSLSEVREEYRCDASGLVTVTIADLQTGYSREYRLGRWAPKQAQLTPGRPRKKKTAASGGRASS